MSDGNDALSALLRQSTCPACGHHVAVSFLDGGWHPLATIAWPRSAEEARTMPRFPLAFVRCVDCGHIYNADFKYEDVPYSDKPNLMYNRGAIWGAHLQRVCDLLLAHLPPAPVVVEIGCGEGHLLRALAKGRPGGRYIGFDPNATVDTADGRIEARRELFQPAVHLGECRPHLVVSRHVLEHLVNPLGFVQALSFAAEWSGLETQLFIEVPCIDRVFETGRIADFYYEHNSHFTTSSFTRLIHHCSKHIEHIEHGYDGEVVFALVRLGRRKGWNDVAEEALRFRSRTREGRAVIGRQLDELYASGRSTAIWGGTGKGAAFIGYYGADAVRFPIVVDSDQDKVGTFVPGTGQEIRFRDHLLTHPVQVILIPTQWRARDILAEMERCSIGCETILIEHQGKLIDFQRDPHPYRS